MHTQSLKQLITVLELPELKVKVILQVLDGYKRSSSPVLNLS